MWHQDATADKTRLKTYSSIVPRGCLSSESLILVTKSAEQAASRVERVEVRRVESEERAVWVADKFGNTWWDNPDVSRFLNLRVTKNLLNSLTFLASSDTSVTWTWLEITQLVVTCTAKLHDHRVTSWTCGNATLASSHVPSSQMPFYEWVGTQLHRNAKSPILWPHD